MYRLRGIRYGSQDYPGPAVFYNMYWEQWIRLELYFWLLQSEENTVLVDVGMDRAFASYVNPHVAERLGNDRGAFRIDIDPPDALAQLGIKATDIDYIILSHYHLDHIAAAPRFPKSTFITSRYGLDWVLHPPYPGLVDPFSMPQEVISFLSEETHKSDGRVILTEDDATPLPGIRIVRTGGHTVDSQIIFVDTQRGRVGLASDNVITYEHLENQIAPGSPMNVLDALKAMEILKKEADLIIPGHEPNLFKIYPDGIIA
jgi:glyoxylase-like metal-dependent hydrolase (beta-lactamase superfamily II)